MKRLRIYSKKSREDVDIKMVDLPPISVQETLLSHFFKEGRHPIRNEKLGKVTDFINPNLNVE